MKWYDAEKPGATRLAIGNAIRLMCRAASREPFRCRSMLEDFAAIIPDWANDRTRWRVASRAVVSIIFGRKARS